MKLGLEASPCLIELRSNESNNVEGIHDRDRVRDYFGRGFLVPGEGIHSDVGDPGPEIIGLIVEPIRKHVGRTAGNDVDQPCWPVGEVDDDGDPPVETAMGPAMFIDADRGDPIKPGRIGKQQRPAEIKHCRTDCVPRRREVLRDGVDAHLVDYDGFQSPQTCGPRKLRAAHTRLRR